MGFVKKLKSSRSKKKSKKLAKSLPVALPSHQSDVERQNGEGRRFSCTSISLGTGSFSLSGVISLTSSGDYRSPSPHSNSTESIGSFSDGEDDSFDEGKPGLRDAAAARLSPIKEVLVSHMPSRVFIRTADLPHMEKAALESRHSSFSNIAEDDLVDHIHRPSSNPPLPSMEHDPNESWVALDDGNGNKAPLAEAAMAALVKTALDASMDKGMWTANGGTNKLLKSGKWDETIFMPCKSEGGPVKVPHARGVKGEDDVLVWSGTWSHKYYGHDLPAIRCEAIINMSAKSLAMLLMDSNRVKEYNKMSIGREDIMVFNDDEKVVTKISVGRSKPPMLGKTLVLSNLLHMEELPGGGEQAGYVIVSRAVAHADDAEAAEDPKVIHSEMLMGLNVIRVVEGEPDRCVLINLNHLRSPMIPMMLAKRLGLSAAVNFINDIRALC
eukprot:CAMPEP_0183715206 /NCGR_PEP_ID=MMETSP0737-20130205/9537_1 /TAXON_ID=385413 /ORGANISM="Thalassiosira miniscula, Strain CCMP1093" /LENGTH=439 /DNA_ID=CAMNT_0025944295 /DNA_START=164 /DNA_END=1483 /DNA_ORIENTATION=+